MFVRQKLEYIVSIHLSKRVLETHFMVPGQCLNVKIIWISGYFINGVKIWFKDIQTNLVFEAL